MRSLNAIPLSGLRVIEAVHRTGSLTRAAEELGVTPGALSQRLAKAEAALGQPLFLRTSSGLRPTAACDRLAPRLTQALTDMAAAVEELRSVDSAVLTVTVAPILASRWMIWRIGRFHAAHPGISLRILPTSEIVDLDHADVDVALRFSQAPVDLPGAVCLLQQRVFPVCAPDLARRLTRLEDLLAHPVIRENEALYGWAPWLDGTGITPAMLAPGPTYADASLCLDAAMMGQGVFMAWQTLASDALERGQVAAPFARRAETGARYWFVPSRFAARRPALRVFRAWLEAEIACSQRHWQTLTEAPDHGI